MSCYEQLVKELKEYGGPGWEGDYDLFLDEETMTIHIETNLQVLWNNKRTINSGFGSEWEWESVGPPERRGGDRWKVDYYLDPPPGPKLKKLVVSQTQSKRGEFRYFLLMTKEELLGVLELLDYKGVIFKEAE